MKSIRITTAMLTALALLGCGPAEETPEPTRVAVSPAELEQFIQTFKDNLVFVEGGEFLMGDFGPQYAPERAP